MANWANNLKNFSKIDTLQRPDGFLFIAIKHYISPYIEFIVALKRHDRVKNLKSQQVLSHI